MVTGEYWWLIYLVFLAIPLARIIPRIISRGRDHISGNGHYDGYKRDGRYDSTAPAAKRTPQEAGKGAGMARRGDWDSAKNYGAPRDAQAGKPGGQTNEMIVLGVLHRGAKTFDAIQKKTGMEEGTLNRALESLENQQMIRVVQKPGLLGSRVEIRPTDKGFRKYYS